MNINEVWGIAYPRVCDFFEEQEGLARTAEGRYECPGAVVVLEEYPEKKMGSLRFPQTHLLFSGGDEAQELYRRFYYRFLSAGG